MSQPWPEHGRAMAHESPRVKRATVRVTSERCPLFWLVHVRVQSAI